MAPFPTTSDPSPSGRVRSNPSLRPVARPRAIVLVCALAIAGIAAIVVPTAPPASAAGPEEVPDLTVSTWLDDTSIAWDIAFLPNGGALVPLRGDRAIRYRSPNGSVRTLDADLDDVGAVGEGGLLGLEIDPDFVRNRRFYTCQRTTDATVEVVSWRLDTGYRRATRLRDPLVGGIENTASGRHSGCRLRFDAAGDLLIGTGDGAIGSAPQDRRSLAGKVLRVNPSTGRGVRGNPFLGRRGDGRIYTLGHRNIQGLDRRPCTDQMWTAEHGPDVDDEINLLRAGGNYGWNPVFPNGEGYNEAVPMTDRSLPGPQVPARWSSGAPTIAISGTAWLRGAPWGAWDGQLAGATLKNQRLHVFGFSDTDRFTGLSTPPQLDGIFGRLRTPVQGPDGALYVTSDSAAAILRVAPLGGPTPGALDVDGDGSDDLVVGVPGGRIGGRADAGAVLVLAGSTDGLDLDRVGLRTQRSLRGAAPATGDRFGASLAYGDVDGDGTADVAIASPGETVRGATGAGAVTVICGRTDGLDRRSSQTFTRAGRLAGAPGADDGFGTAVAFGDFDGDGYDDLAIGVPGDTVAGTPGAGAVVVSRGSSRGLRTDGSVQIDRAGAGPGTPRPGGRLGSSLAVGDFDGDGYDDLAVGEPGGAGAVMVFSGSRSGLRAADGSDVTPTGSLPGDGTGSALATGDLDGDGVDDLVIGVPGADVESATDAGAVVWLRGSGDGLVGDGTVVTQSGSGSVADPEPGDGFGAALAVGDVDGDGRHDLVVGAPGERVGQRDGAGAVTIVVSTLTGPDPATSTTWTQAGAVPGLVRAEAGFGSAVRAVDIDGDGDADVAVGAPGTRVRGRRAAGAVVVLTASPTGVDGDGVMLTRRGGLPGRPGVGDALGAAL